MEVCLGLSPVFASEYAIFTIIAWKIGKFMIGV